MRLNGNLIIILGTASISMMGTTSLVPVIPQIMTDLEVSQSLLEESFKIIGNIMVSSKKEDLYTKVQSWLSNLKTEDNK